MERISPIRPFCISTCKNPILSSDSLSLKILSMTATLFSCVISGWQSNDTKSGSSFIVWKYSTEFEVANVGTVIQVADGIARVHGLEKAMQGELLEFPHEVYGMVMSLPSSDWHHRVNRLNSRLQWCIYRFTGNNTGSHTFNRTDFICFNWALTINWLSQRTWRKRCKGSCWNFRTKYMAWS